MKKSLLIFPLFFIFLFFSFSSLSLLAKPRNSSLASEDPKKKFKVLQGEMGKIKDKGRKEFIELHRKFFHQVCRPGTEEKFWKLFKEYRGDGHYLPKTLNGRLDKETLFRFIPEIKRKIQWIDKQIGKVQKRKNFKKEMKELASLEEDMEKLVHYKEVYEDSTREVDKIIYRDKSKYQMIKFRKKFNDFILSIPFLTSYRFPVDHFELRENYDEVKHGESAEEKRRANEVYFYRKIAQDGAENPNGTASDRFLRTMIDTLILNLRHAPELLSEKLRYDLFSSFSGLKRQLKRGPRRQAKRLAAWKKKIERQLHYYTDLKKNRVKVGRHYETGEEVVKTSVVALQNLRKFVFSKLKEVYDFWRSRDDRDQAFYVLVTTLFNEVGRVDGKDALERRDVLGVMINRYFNSKYNYIPESDWLYPYFSDKKTKGPLRDYPWLNVMFKEGEFSYTYYFIHGVVRVFCPDQTKIAKRLRHENLNLAIEALSHYDGSFKGIRYFSRASMLGRISMDQIWSGYTPIPERAGGGLPKKEQRALKKFYEKHSYNYRYHFLDPKGVRFKVVEIEGKVYSFNLENQQFYLYRSPHLFKYFAPKK